MRMKLERNNLADQAYRLLTERIVRGEIPGGVRLTEQALSAELGVSRTPLREAMRKLAAEGLLTALPKGGFETASHDAAEIAELFECRAKLECLALETALGRIPEEELRELLEQLKIEALPVSLAVDVRMHALIADYCGNRFLASTLHALVRRSAPYRTLRNYDNAEAPQRERRELLMAMLARDAETSARLLGEHLRSVISGEAKPTGFRAWGPGEVPRGAQPLGGVCGGASSDVRGAKQLHRKNRDFSRGAHAVPCAARRKNQPPEGGIPRSRSFAA